MMESVVNLIFSAENVRMLVLLVFGFCGYVLIKGQMRGLEYSLGKRIDCVDHKIDSVEVSLNKRMDGLDRKIDSVENSLNKRIDGLDHKIDSVENTIEALTFMLEKNKFLSVEDRNYISGRL